MTEEMGRREFIRQGTVAGVFATKIPFAHVLGQPTHAEGPGVTTGAAPSLARYHSTV